VGCKRVKLALLLSVQECKVREVIDLQECKVFMLLDKVRVGIENAPILRTRKLTFATNSLHALLQMLSNKVYSN
jgi:hypothetical protein